MRYSKKLNRAFTLVELMIVVAIIGVLAALAIYGVRKYLLSSKTAEAKNTIGAITRAAVSAFEKEKFDAQLMTSGGTSSTTSHSLCYGAKKAPASIPAGTKITPNPADGQDFNTGSVLTGWKCLKFSMNDPTYYQYSYLARGAGDDIKGSNSDPAGAGNTDALWESQAAGNLNGDSVTSYFLSYGGINLGQAITATTIYEQNSEE